jgi:hypothetical protein
MRVEVTQDISPEDDSITSKPILMKCGVDARIERHAAPIARATVVDKCIVVRGSYVDAVPIGPKCVVDQVVSVRILKCDTAIIV